MVENGCCNAHDGTCIPRYKRRKISAIRNFPRGIGHKVSRNNVRHIDNSSDGVGNRKSINGLKDESYLDNQNVGAHELPKLLNFELKKSPNGAAADYSIANASLPSVFIFPSQPEKPMIDSNILVKNLGRKYPPRRRISAVRHFPLSLGKDVPQHSKDKSIRAQASSNCNSGSQVKVGDVKLNLSGKCSSIESDEASKAERNVSRTLEHLPALNSVGRSQDECQSGDFNKLHAMSSSSCGSTDKNSIGTTTECGLPHRDYTSQVATSESGNKKVDSNVKLQKLDGNLRKKKLVCKAKIHNSNQTLENEVDAEITVPSKTNCSRGQYLHDSDNSVNTETVTALMAGSMSKRIDVQNEEKSLRSETSDSTETAADGVNVNASRAAPISMEIVELEDECSRIKFSSKNADNYVIVCALMAAPNCPWRQSKVVNLGSQNGIFKSKGLKLGSSRDKKKSKVKRLLEERRSLIAVSKRRKASPNYNGTMPLKASNPNAKVVEAEGDKISSCEHDEGCDDFYDSHVTRDVDIMPEDLNNAETENDSDDGISCSKVRETLRQYQAMFRKLMHKEDAISIRGAVGCRRDDHASAEIVEDQGEYVSTCKQTVGPVPVQRELDSNVIKKLKKSDVLHGVCLQDISEGIETTPIRAVNTIDDEQPPSFKYITSMLYPDWCRPLPLRGCNCDGDCSASPDCACAVRNGVEIPFNDNGCIVDVKPLVYECGPSCNCPPSCPNRVSQFGIRFQLEIFKTVSRGWGVRSRNRIPLGSFICEYLGELLDDKQAEERIGNDEYLFDLRSSFSDRKDMGMEFMDDVAFTIDAKNYGNVGRFINHSCSSNLYAQNVLYDHEDGRVPHIMLFAAEDIPPLQELTYHYNYKIGEVFDVNGNVKIKQCFCGSKECTGRMY